MIAVVQRVSQARVLVGGAVSGQIGPGLLALVAVVGGDRAQDCEWMAHRLLTLRAFRNAGRHFDIDVSEARGGILLVSNFTVAADTRRGRRPSFDRAAAPDEALGLFDDLVGRVRAGGVPVATGVFAADMAVDLTNDGPATFILDSRQAPPTPQAGG
jgi:D-tyrosyl-tRNA(Tyr) deacylase